MLPVFNSPLHQKQFNTKGYILLPALLSADEVKTLSALFAKYSNIIAQPFHTSHFSSDVDYKNEVHQTISNVVFTKAQPYLNHFKPVFGNFMVKNPDPNVSMDLHADWTYVDEEKWQSVAIWVPLIDVDENNGCLGIIEGSHKVMSIIRGPRIRQSSQKHDTEWKNKYGTLLPMRAGDAIIYNHSLLHYSYANKSRAVRPAINLSLIPENAPCIHYCVPEGTEDIQLYAVPDTGFYINYTHFQTPLTNTLLKTLPASTAKLIDKKMESLWKIRLYNKIAALF